MWVWVSAWFYLGGAQLCLKMLVKDGSRDEAIFQLRGTERGAQIPGERADNSSQHIKTGFVVFAET